nr:uncharacterized protein LOC111415281 [Onthophagus taurus]
MFFSAIRSRSGFNNNPTAEQFEGAYKRLSLKTEIEAPTSANCVCVDNTSILTVSSGNQKDDVDDLLNAFSETATDEGSEQVPYFGNLSSYLINVTEYISGLVSRKIAKSIKCAICADALFAVESNSYLLNRKNRGGLLTASNDVVSICGTAENMFRFYVQSNNHPDIHASHT